MLTFICFQRENKRRKMCHAFLRVIQMPVGKNEPTHWVAHFCTHLHIPTMFTVLGTRVENVN